MVQIYHTVSLLIRSFPCSRTKTPVAGKKSNPARGNTPLAHLP